LKDININVSNNEFDFYEIYKPDFDLFSKKLTHVGILFFYLKKKGKEQIIHGKKKCNKSNIIYFGRELDKPKSSNEISFLLPYFIDFSDYLNRKFNRNDFNLRYFSTIQFYFSLILFFLFFTFLNFIFNFVF
jgi:hypothetical protein